MSAPAGPPVREIGIVLYPGAQLAAVHGLTDLFGIANRMAAEARLNAGRPLRITHWSPDGDGEREIRCVYRSDPSAAPQPGILILPPTLVSLPDPATCASLVRWLRRHHARGVRLVSVCSGVFLVAGTGLLDGRTVSTHRRCAQALVESHPAVGVDTEARIIDHADILTAGGFMAWVDVGLILVERLLGAAVRAETARFVCSDATAGQAPHFAGLAPRHAHDDPAVRRAQAFIHVRDGQGVSLASLAAAALLGRRTLLRRFASATGMTPMEYCRAVRLARARELLEAGRLPLQEIAGNLGYGDLSSFARAFRRAHGAPPGAFRKQHGGDVGGQAGCQPRLPAGA
jgi:transcriptional regulator GlxA family with amidase domain